MTKNLAERIAQLFADRRKKYWQLAAPNLTIDDIIEHVFDFGARLTRAQWLAATRATFRLLRRVKAQHRRGKQLIHEAHENTEKALGREQRYSANEEDGPYQYRLHADPTWQEAHKLLAWADIIGVWTRIVRGDRPGYLRNEYDFWCTTSVNATLYFHPPDVPMRIWAVSVQPAGIIWAEAEVTNVTYSNVMVRYDGKMARLNRESLWYWWAYWRGCRFVSSRTGRIAVELDAEWQRRYAGRGSVPLTMLMPLEQARALLGVQVNYTRDEVMGAFRQAAKRAHPDVGGTAEMFRAFVEARDRLLAALGTSEPAPKPPSYYPEGVRVVYWSGGRSSQNRLAGSTKRLTQA